MPCCCGQRRPHAAQWGSASEQRHPAALGRDATPEPGSVGLGPSTGTLRTSGFALSALHADVPASLCTAQAGANLVRRPPPAETPCTYARNQDQPAVGECRLPCTRARAPALGRRYCQLAGARRLPVPGLVGDRQFTFTGRTGVAAVPSESEKTQDRERQGSPGFELLVRHSPPDRA